MKLSLQGYTIRDWLKDDAPSITRYANNRRIWINLRDAFLYPSTLGDAEVFLSRAMQSVPRTHFAIATETEAIGSIALSPGQDVHRFTCELSYWLAEPSWGKGIMTGAVRTLSEYTFKERSMHRIFAVPYTTNPASARVLEKAGFVYEGIIRENVFKDGRVPDQFMYAKLNPNTIGRG